MIQAYNVNMSYKEDIQVLNDVSFEVQQGEFVFLVGESGAGKTTILRLLYRGLIPTSGELVVAGRRTYPTLHSPPYRQLVRIFQGRSRKHRSSPH